MRSIVALLRAVLLNRLPPWYEHGVWLGVAAMAAVSLIWTLVPSATIVTIRAVPPQLLALLRLGMGLALVAGVYVLRGGSLRALTWNRWSAIGGVAIGINYACFSLAFWYTSAIAGTLVIQVQFAVLAVLASIVLRERLTLARVLGIATVVAGIGLLVLGSGSAERVAARDFGLGSAIMLLGGVGFGVFALAGRAEAHRAGIDRLVPMTIVGTAVMALIAVLLPPPPGQVQLPPGPIQTALLVTALGLIGTGFTFVLTFVGLRRLDAATAGVITSFAPLANLLVARLALREPITPVIVISTLAVVCGVVLLVRSAARSAGYSMNVSISPRPGRSR